MNDQVTAALDKLGLIPILKEKFEASLPAEATLMPKDWLQDPAWYNQRIADTGHRWSCNDPIVNATMWWYSSSHTLVSSMVSPMLIGQACFELDFSRGWIRKNGYLGGFPACGFQSLEQGARKTLSVAKSMISKLSECSGVRERVLEMMLADSVPMCAFGVAAEGLATQNLANKVVGQVISTLQTSGLNIPNPRFWDVSPTGVTPVSAGEVPENTRRFVRRSSCCLIYKTGDGKTDHQKCVLCPKQKVTERNKRLLQFVYPA